MKYIIYNKSIKPNGIDYIKERSLLNLYAIESMIKVNIDDSNNATAAERAAGKVLVMINTTTIPIPIN